MEKAFNDNFLVSIIVPIYNVEKYLKRCIDSIINQTYTNLEIVLVNDGSTDNCEKICNEYSKKDVRIKVIHKKNGGVSSARNEGIRNSSGHFITFVDSDDWIENEMIYKMLKLSKKYDSDYVMIGYNETDNVQNKTKYSIKESIIEKDEFMRKFFKIGNQECIFYPWGKLIKRNLIEDDLFPVDCRIGEDVIANYKTLMKTNKIAVSNEKLYNYFQHAEGLTRSGFSSKDFDLINVWDNMLQLTKNTKYYEYAKINRARTDFTILTRMSMNVKYDIIIDKYEIQYKEMLTNLKRNKKLLIKSKIPLTRKVMIEVMCFNYKLFSNIFYTLKKVKI